VGASFRRGVPARVSRPKQQARRSGIRERAAGRADEQSIRARAASEDHRSAVWVRGAGFFLNDEMDDFAAKPGEPNMFGLVQGEQNAVAPGKRMLSAMTPTIVLGRNGQVLLVVG